MIRRVSNDASQSVIVFLGPMASCDRPRCWNSPAVLTESLINTNPFSDAVSSFSFFLWRAMALEQLACSFVTSSSFCLYKRWLSWTKHKYTKCTKIQLVEQYHLFTTNPKFKVLQFQEQSRWHMTLFQTKGRSKPINLYIIYFYTSTRTTIQFF